MQNKPFYLKIALPVPLPILFDYLPPNNYLEPELPLPGIRVKVPFGPRELIGVLVEVGEQVNTGQEKLKHALEFIDQTHCLTEELLHLCQWASQYYRHPLGEVISSALPKRYRKGDIVQLDEDSAWVLSTEAKGLPSDALKRSKKQQLLFQYLLKNDCASKDDCRRLEISSATLKAMKTKGLIENSHSSQPPKDNLVATILAEKPKPLNAEQAEVLEKISYHQFQCSLLEGVTGSGKTEVYMQAIARALGAGRQALVLIPEIGLTPQTLKRFHQRFQVAIAELHSRVSELERAKNWLKAKEGLARIIIGTRLAALAPTQNLGIIIIDEEHDASFKQQDGFRYSARDLSIYRASQAKIPIILGSATPALESLHNAFAGKFQHLELTRRAGKANMPTMQAVDIRNTKLSAGLSPGALEAIRSTIDAGRQALIFLNRRGYAPLLYCHACGWNARCPSCEMNFTLHQNPKLLCCHHCDTRRPAPTQCPACNHGQLSYSGTGTEQTWESMTTLFPHVPIFRIDRDTTKNKHDLGKVLEEINRGEACILVGTQMLAKGHHLESLDLVVITNTDQGLMSPDFKSIERMGQLITQVAGRAGRGEQRGRVLLQSYQPEHPGLQTLITQGYHQFAIRLLEKRKQAHLPPYSYAALLRAESKRQQNAIELLQLAKRVLNSGHRKNIKILGPLPAFIEKVNNRYRYQLQLTSLNRSNLHHGLKDIQEVFSRNALSKRTKWSLDVDPIEY